MAVPEQIPVVNYVADGVVKKFDVPFEYDQQSDLHLYVDGVEPTIDKYFFADNAFNFYIAPTVGQDVKIKRTTPKERNTDYDLHTNTVRPRVLNSDFDRLWYVLQEVFSDVGGLSQAVQDEIIARIQGDEDLLNQLTAEISARMLGDESVTEDLKNYVNQVVGAIIGDPSFTGIDAKNVNDASGETQQQVNYNGGSKWHSRVGGYLENERVVLANGDIVKSTIDGNANNPNVDMTGWVKEISIQTVESISDILTVSNPQLGQTVLAKSINSAIKHGGGFFEYNGSEWDLIPLTQLRLSSFGDTSNTVNAFTRLFAYIQALPTTLSENGQPIRKITVDLEGLTWNLTNSVFGVQGIGGLRFTNGTIRADDGFVGDYLCEFTDAEALRAYHFITFDNIIFDANYKTSCFRINRALKCGFSTCHFLRWKENGYGLVVGKTPTDTLGAAQEAHEVFVNCGSTFAQYDFSTVWSGQVCSGTALYINTYDGHYSDFVISYVGRGIEHICTGLNIFDNIHIYGAEEKDYGFFIDCTSTNPFVNLVNIYMDECSIRVLNPNQIAITNSKIFRNDQSTRGLIIFDTSQQYVDASRIVMTGNHFNTSTALGKKQVEFVTESGGVWGSSAGSLIKSHSNTYLGYVEPIETGSDIQDVYKYNGYNLTKRYPLDETGTFTFDLKTVHNKQNGQNVSASCSEWLITSNWQATSGNGVGVFRLVVFLMPSGQYACTIEAEGVGFTSGVKNLPIGFKSVPVLSSDGVLTVVLGDFYRGSIFRCDTRQTKVIN